VDAFGEVMRLLRIQGQLYGRLEFTAPWGLDFPGEKGICLMVLRGSCFLRADEQGLIPLAAGDFIFLPAPHTYSLQSNTDISVRSVLTVTSDAEFRRSRLITHGGDGLPTSLIAGCFRFAPPESAWLVKYLPPIVRVSASDAPSSPWFQSSLQFLATELAQELPGSSVVIDRLSEILFVQAMRTWIQAPYLDANPSWLRGLTHPQIGEALQRMYTEPERAWTIPELARCVSMSRSAFASRFRELVGETPLDHLTQWRMVRAASMLRENRSLTLAAIAYAVGYEAESAFGKVFRRVMGVSPGQYRQNHLQDMKQTG